MRFRGPLTDAPALFFEDAKRDPRLTDEQRTEIAAEYPEAYRAARSDD